MENSILTAHEDAITDVTTDTTFTPWIDGEQYLPNQDVTIETLDPAVTRPIAAIPACDGDDVDAAVEAAWDAYDREWEATSPAERASMLREWVDELRDHEDELTRLECLDTGKPIEQARGEVQGAFDTLDYYASLCRTIGGDQIAAGNGLHAYTRKEPFGVVGQIIPWNFPIWSLTWKLGPALAAGNTSVLKPAQDAPLTAIRAAQLSADIFPDGVVNVVPGTGSDVGNALTGHGGVQKVSFTGSRRVGERVMQGAASHIAPVTLELGSKSPFLVFPDANPSKVGQAVADGIYYSSGEICDAFSRAIVHTDIYEEFLDAFLEAAESYTCGDPLEEGTTMGPLTTADQYESVRKYISLGKQSGSNLIYGGGTPDGPLDRGWYVEPTVFTDVDSDMRIAREEIFGPVQTVQKFDSYEEGIERANDTRFGLSAGIGTEDTSLAHRAAADLEAGIVYVNDYGPILPEAPYGGFKESGIGKDLGEASLDHYLQTKSVYMNLENPTC
ncbi:aldehyde dehydrogenase family protein [Haladaptatus sp. DYF46]|uniref:aldehyde dehydrogenase family protein n=1 Tax=Haladaptatus sp. DYF46 TaxID=2886041 RepID=UPI001E63833E|nr:aldehyde dehydrogenase family protein [Haladaptatus sp. DYF46]